MAIEAIDPGLRPRARSDQQPRARLPASDRPLSLSAVSTSQRAFWPAVVIFCRWRFWPEAVGYDAVSLIAAHGHRSGGPEHYLSEAVRALVLRAGRGFVSSSRSPAPLHIFLGHRYFSFLR